MKTKRVAVQNWNNHENEGKANVEADMEKFDRRNRSVDFH